MTHDKCTSAQTSEITNFLASPETRGRHILKAINVVCKPLCIYHFCWERSPPYPMDIKDRKKQFFNNIFFFFQCVGTTNFNKCHQTFESPHCDFFFLDWYHYIYPLKLIALHCINVLWNVIDSVIGKTAYFHNLIVCFPIRNTFFIPWANI